MRSRRRSARSTRAASGSRSRSTSASPTGPTSFERILDGRIASGELHPRTKGSYASTLNRGREAFGSLYLREIGNPELRRFLDPFTKLKPASRLRYLRELSACLTVAVGDRYMEVNPVPAFTKATKLKPPKRGKAPFEDGELERLWTELGKVEQDEERVHLYACRFSAETGLRLGELIGLDWPNVDLLHGRVRVEHQWDDGTGSLIEPKDREPRVVYLTPQARTVLDEWTAIVGVRTEGPVFPAPGGLQARAAGAATALRGGDGERGHPQGTPRPAPAAQLPLAALLDERADAATRVPPAG